MKIIRIETPTIAKALKIFETINDRGVGLDAMDLLKNLLFMHAKDHEFGKLKDLWKSLTDEIYLSGEKPLRFLRYYLLATFDVDSKLREDAIYDWFQRNEAATNHATNPVGFAQKLLAAAKAYAQFARGNNPKGVREPGIANTRLLGGKSIKQHFIVLLAGRHLGPDEFSRLAEEVEKTLFVWLITGTAGKEYERRIVEAAHRLRELPQGKLDDFLAETFVAERRGLHKDFEQVMQTLRSYDTRQFRLRYLIAKITQHVDLLAYGPSEARCNLAEYTAGGNDIEHILPDRGDAEAVEEFGDGGTDQEIIQSLGNLLLIEKSINRAISNKSYSKKVAAYSQSKFLLTKCQYSRLGTEIGLADKITKTVQSLENYAEWNAENVKARQDFLATLSTRVWCTSPAE
ncbi:DUF262 domain-containing protein [Zhengella mangrovi]|uniref:DUF262 domain-containing protein n=1 Tax=Zhengella mangrovi TaxID=1982044 RepID=UPI001FE11DBF|nr:DUF262 domain-containing protein [Zhengella mangrovi]